MTERMDSQEVKVPESIKAFEALRQRLELLTLRSESLGLNVHAIVEHSGHRIFKQADEPVFGASLGKLPLAVMAAENLEPYAPLPLHDVHGVEPGLTAAELVEKMLKKSDNVSYRVLAEVLGGPEEINKFYHGKGWQETRVLSAPNGRAQLAETTATESLAQLKYILGSSLDNELAEIARQALSEQNVHKHGVRQLKLDDPSVHIFNKTGEYNGDLHDPVIYRHDVGSIFGPDARVSYAIMTSVPNEAVSLMTAKKFLADGVVKHFGAELVTYVGGSLKPSVGARAVRLAIVRS